MADFRGFSLAGFVLALFLDTAASAQRLTATWQDQQLGVVMQRIASTIAMPLWIDRRVDPTQKVNAQFVDVSLGQALETLGAQHHVGFAEVSGVIYVGPPDVAQGLATLVRRVRTAAEELPEAQRDVWLKSAAWTWPRVSEPRALLQDLMNQTGVRLVGDEFVPHDLWSAGDLPPLPLVDRVVLLLAGFELTCEISADGKTCRVVPLRHPLPVDQRDLPSWVTGKSRRPAPKEGQPRYSLRLENQPAGRVLEQMAAQLRLEVIWDDASLAANNLSRESLVTCDVTDADLDTLLAAILEPAGMTFTREGQKVMIHAPRRP